MVPESRGNTILQLIVEAYIQDAQPVSSSGLARRHPTLALSSATIRSVMAELEIEGLLSQTHSSSGRVPTEAGLRVYLDRLVSRKLRPWDRSRLEKAAAEAADISQVSAQLSQALAQMTGQMVLVAQPRFLGRRLREIGLVRYDQARMLAYFVSPSGLLQQKLLHLDFDVEPELVQEIQNYLNARLRDRTLEEVRALIARELAANATHLDRLTAVALKIGEQLLPEVQIDVFVEGTSHLLDQPEFADLRKVRALLRAIEEKHTLLSLVSRILDHSGVRVMLGSEHDVADVRDLACIGCAYEGDAGRGAAVTVMGSSRMDYGRLVPLVQYASEVYGRFWEQM